MNWLPRIGSSKKERFDVKIILHTKDATLEKISEIFYEDSEIPTLTESISFPLCREKINKDIKKISQIVPYILSTNPEWREKLQGSFMIKSSYVYNDRKYSVLLSENIDSQKYVFEFHKVVEGQNDACSKVKNEAAKLQFELIKKQFELFNETASSLISVMADLKEFSSQLLHSNPSNTHDAKMENGLVEASQQVDVHRNDNVQSEDRKNEATGCEGRHKKNDLVDTKDPSNEPSKEESIKDNKEEQAPGEKPQGDDDNDAKGFKMLDNKPGDRMKHENNGNNKQFNQSQSNHNAISEQQLKDSNSCDEKEQATINLVLPEKEEQTEHKDTCHRGSIQSLNRSTSFKPIDNPLLSDSNINPVEDKNGKTQDTITGRPPGSISISSLSVNPELTFEANEFDNFKTEYNILMLGEKGVGKTTFINAFAHNIDFGDFDEAVSTKPKYLIPGKFYLNNSAYDIGEDSRKLCYSLPYSTTLTHQAYEIEVDKKALRFIDTPGVDELINLDVLKRDFAEIIQAYKNIDFICILLHPDNARKTGNSDRMIDLLLHLKRTTSAKPLFCFTHANSTHFASGATFSIWKEYFKELNLTIEMENNVFHFDNDHYIYFWAKCIDVSIEEHNYARYNWKESKKSLENMVNHIFS